MINQLEDQQCLDDILANIDDQTYLETTIQNKEDNQTKASIRKINTFMYYLIQQHGMSNIQHQTYSAFFKSYQPNVFVKLLKPSNDLCVNQIFNSFSFITDEQLFRQFVYLLVQVCIRFSDSNIAQNPVLNECFSHSNTRFFQEILLQLYNRVDNFSLKDISDLIILLIDFDSEFFYSNDFSMIFEISLRQAQDDDLQRCVTSRFERQMKKKIDNLKSLIDAIIYYEDPDVLVLASKIAYFLPNEQ